MSELLIVWILFAHWVADFVCQSDWMAKEKSKNMDALYLHILTYALVMSAMTMNVVFGCANALIHLFIDYFTSRWSSKLWAKGRFHDFFVVIGFDQFIHVACLLTTWKLLA